MDLPKKFDVPAELLAFMKLDDGVEARVDIANLLTMPEKKGELISLANLAELEVATFISRFFENVDAARRAPVAPLKKKAFFNDKVEKAKEIVQTLDPVETNFGPHFAFLDALRDLKNEASHTMGGSRSKSAEFANDPEIVVLATAFPTNVFSRLSMMRDYFSSLVP